MLLSGEEEKDINDYFIESAFPTRQEVETVVNVIEDDPDGLSVNDIMGRIN